MELTAAQRQIAEHRDGRLWITGEAGSGRTTALQARYLRLVAQGHKPSSILVVCPTRAAATGFRDAVLPRLAGGFDALMFTTWFGVAFDLVSRARGPVRLLSSGEQRAVVRHLLAGESPGDWPALGHFLGRAAFAEEVAAALVDGDPGAHPELGRFARRYTEHLDRHGLVDRAGLLAAAAAAVSPGRYAHVLVDDHVEGPPEVERLLAAVHGGTVAVVSERELPWPALNVDLGESFRRPAAPVLVTCPHRSTEPEAVAGELLAAHEDGVAWSDMAVLVREPRRRGRAVARALSRYGIPVAPGPALGPADDDPAVAAIVDLLRWALGDAGRLDRLLASPLSVIGETALVALRDDVAARAATATPAELAFLIWERGLGHLVGNGNGRDDAALDAVVAFLDWLERRAEHDPSERVAGLLAGIEGGAVELDPWRTSVAAGGGEAVTVTSIAAAAGRQWHTVVLAGCVEGELPRIRGRAPLFDRSPASPAERRRGSLAAERKLFRTARTRATGRLVGTAAPEPGVLLSRFVEGWDRREARPPARRGAILPTRPPTENPVGVFPGGALTLSASQLDTYDDCPLRYAYQYGLRVKDDASTSMALGSLVHEVLAEFLRPDRQGPRSREALLALAAERWTDGIARYRPQVEECRRDYYAMLELWWASEGEGLPAAGVVATEHRFDIEVAGVHLVGSIDRVDRAPGGDGIRIVDYKTGRHDPRPDQLPDDLQLAVYHLAASRDPQLAALGPPRQLQLLYLRTMKAFEQPILAGHAETTRARVLAAADNIRNERFEPSVDGSCRNCSFHRLCPLQREGREVGAG